MRVRELEVLLARVRRAGMGQLSYDMWERWGAAHADPEEAEKMKRDFAESLREHAAAKSELEALVVTTRATAPEVIVAWADAHQAYLKAFLDECAERGEADGARALVATRERLEWSEVAAGKRLFVEENLHYVTGDADRYRRAFGFDPEG
jgi:hypothetical protein